MKTNNKVIKSILSTAALSTAALMITPANATPIETDVVAIVDESGSMSAEHAWLPTMITDLNAALLAEAGGDSFSARYGLTGFGAIDLHGTPAHKHLVAGGDFGTAPEFGVAAGTLISEGLLEDGHEAIDFALSNYAYSPSAVKNLIFITDEDSDDLPSPGIDVTSVAADLASAEALLNAVINVTFQCGDGSSALGMTSTTGYKADGSGGFTTCVGATAISGFGTSIADYVDLALDTGGAAWDLNQLREGGLLAESFTNAFVDIKVEEIINVPEPTTVAMFGIGVLGMGMLKRKKALSVNDTV